MNVQGTQQEDYSKSS